MMSFVIRALSYTGLCLALLFPNNALAQAKAPENQHIEEIAPEDDGVFRAPVVIDGVELFLVRGTTALPGTERAEQVANRITAIAEANDLGTVEITFNTVDLGNEIFADGVLIAVVTDADAELEQVDPTVLTQLQGDVIHKAILSYRAARTSEARLHSILEVGGWTLAFVLISTLIFWLRRRLKTAVNTLVKRHFASVESATQSHVQADAIAALIRFGVNFVLFSLLFLGIYYYLSLILLSFAETRYVAQLLLTYVTTPVLNILIGFILYIPDLITLAIIAFLTMYVIKGFRVFFDAVAAGTFQLGDFEKHWATPTFNIVRVMLIMISIVFAFPYMPGSDSAAFQGLTLLVGAMLSLGANSVVSNILSGLFVIYRRSTSIGDRITIGEHTGDVIQIKLMETHLKSIKNELISIPNAQLLNSEVINYSKKIDGNGLLLHTTVGIGYEETPAKIEAMLIEAARRTRDLKTRPAPFVLWAGLADYAINYQINAYTTRGTSIPRIKSDLHKHIVAVFNENKVQIMTPSYIADTAEPKIAKNTWDGELAGGEE
jgi:small-conductance mechanosensitive channel